MPVTYKHMCMSCGEMYTSKRSHSQTCSTKCRNRLYRARKRMIKEAKKHTLTMDEYAEVNAVKNVSFRAGVIMDELLSLYGKDLTMKVVDLLDEVKLCSHAS